MNINELEKHAGREFTERFCAFNGRNVPVTLDKASDDASFVCLCADSCPHTSCRRRGDTQTENSSPVTR